MVSSRDISRASHRTGARSPFDYSHKFITDKSVLDAMIPRFKQVGIAMGNTPYHQLVHENNTINDWDDEKECRIPKPNVSMITRYLRTSLFDPFDPPTLFYAEDTHLPPDVSQFIDQYGFLGYRYSHNQWGERTTLPTVLKDKKILIAGDSVAAGSMVGDGDTLSSQLQKKIDHLQFINIGINGANSRDNLCSLERAEKRYAKQIKGLIYVYCDNDLFGADKYPAKRVLAWLEAFKKRNNLDFLMVVRAPYIYAMLPQLKPNRPDIFRNQLNEAIKETELMFIDYRTLAFDEQITKKSLYAPLALFVDHVHLSPYGTQRLADVLIARLTL